MADDNWRDRAACREHDPSLWFPERVDGQDNHGREAKAVCAQCSAIVPCLEQAIDEGEKVGIWGGAGGDLLRWLRRVRNQGDATAWEEAVELHLRQLDGEPVVINRNGPKATHGRAITYNRGCRCEPCRDSRRTPDGRRGTAEAARYAARHGPA